MTIRHLLKSQANRVFGILNDNGWNPADFEWRDAKSLVSKEAIISKLVHKSSGYYFTLDNVGGGFRSDFSPAAERELGVVIFTKLDSQLNGLARWLGWLKRETEAPDLWGAVAQETNLIESATSDMDNTPFTADEKTYVISGLNEIKEHLLTAHKLDPELVEGHIKYLVESSDRLGRKDWKNLLLATIVSVVMSGALPSESVREVFMFIGTVLREILKTQLLLT